MGEKEAEESIEDLYNQDQQERLTVDWDKASKEQIEKLRAKDQKRREQVKEMIQERQLKTGLDFHHAAMIFQHGDALEDYKLAHELAGKAIELGDDSALWLYAATLDRWLLSQRKPQKFGTQFRMNDQKEWELGPVDPNTTDEERAQYNVSPLSEALQRFKKKYQK